MPLSVVAFVTDRAKVVELLEKARASGELVHELGKAWWRGGYASETMNAVLDWAFGPPVSTASRPS